MGQPVMAFLQDEYKMSRNRSVMIFGSITIFLSLWCVVFYGAGAFGEFDDWSGTFALVVFALLETIAFVWVFGIDKAWAEINRGADITVPVFFKYVMKYVTPVFLLVVFVGSLLAPIGGDWVGAFSSFFSGNGWSFDSGSIIGKILHVGIEDTRWFIDGSPTRVFIIDITRTLLLATFVAIAMLIRHAWSKKSVTN